MDVSDNREPGGQELIDAVVTMTGLPSESVQAELGKIIQSSGHDPAQLTLDELRAAMVAYLESLQAEFEAADSVASGE